MSYQLAHPGHVRYVRQWMKHNADTIAAAVVPPSERDKGFTGANFVLWLERLLESHQRLCDQELARRPPFTEYTGD
jgi:hypothetical protein